MSGRSPASARSGRRLDQWLWFARLAKSRSLAARLCTGGAVLVNGAVARKASRTVHIGDTIVVFQGARRRTMRISALGTRRGPTAEARCLYEEVGGPAAAAEQGEGWTPLLVDDAIARDDAAG